MGDSLSEGQYYLEKAYPSRQRAVELEYHYVFCKTFERDI